MMLPLLLACTGTPVDTGLPAACDTGLDVTWHSFGDGFFRTYCQACHSGSAPDRSGAPAGVDFDTPEQVRAQAARIRARVLDEETMPVGGGVSAEDVVLLDRYLECGL
jgi:uncharacterized membrane protein